MPQPRYLGSKKYRLGDDPDGIAGAGGATVVLKSAAAILKIGDCAYVTTTTGRINKSTTQANAKFFVGVVVGGGSAIGSDQAFFDPAVVGLNANPATADLGIVVQVNGIANVVCGAAVASGDQLMFDTGTAGRVIPGTTAGQIVGIALILGTGAGSVIQMLIQPR